MSSTTSSSNLIQRVQAKLAILLLASAMSCWYLTTMSTASWSVMNSQTPSLHIIINLKSSLISISTTSGIEITPAA